ncbi:MAG: dihydrodipicolinate synthase family protein [Porphyromonadaceae bacterium]|nr:dihydrodipicolinate synthase family protein [Porphyromonadaceae bacterium]
MNTNFELPLSGIITPLVTPLLDNDTLDKEGLERLIEHTLEGGVHGIFILGTTGEAPSLSFSLREEMIKQTSKILKGRLPLLVGISDTSLSDSVRLSYSAAEYGADAVVSASPYYYAIAQPELIDFYEALIPKIALPIYLYNMPTHTKVTFAPSTVYQLSENEKVLGFKDSSANGTYLQSIIHIMGEKKGFSIFVGPEEMTAEALLLGASGGVDGGANMFPKLYVDLYNAAIARDIEKVRELQSKVMQISATIYSQGKYGSSFLKGVKCALSILGICSDTLALPFVKFDAEERAKIAEAIEKLDL